MSFISAVIAALGASPLPVYLETVGDSDFSIGGTAVAGIEFETGGDCVDVSDSHVNFVWLRAGEAGDYEVFLSGTGDTPTGDLLDTWIDMATTPNWRLSQGGSGTKDFTGTVQIRRAATGTVVASATLSIHVEAEPDG